MRTLETVVLQYTVKDRLIFQSYAEFLRLAGIYVWEYPEEYHSGDEAKADFDDAFVFNITEHINASFGDKKPSWQEFYMELKRALASGYVSLKLMRSTKELIKAFPVLNAVYKKYNLLQAASTLQYFRLKSDKVLEAAESFENAGMDLKKRVSDNSDIGANRHIRYALLYCKQKANLGRRMCDQPLLVLADELADECLSLAEDFPDFSNAWVLRGLAYETAEKYSKEAVEAFNHAAVLVRKYPYASSIYYWIGKRCEAYRDPEKIHLTDLAYRIGYNLDPKYRLCYKMASMSERWSRWDDVNKYYDECREYIAKKEDYLDPLEQEYLYKSAIRAAYNCLAHLKDAERALIYLQSAEELRESIISDQKEGADSVTKYYFDLYGKNAAPDYINLELSRMGPLQLYQYLAKVYEILDEYQKAMRYRSLFEAELVRAKEKKRKIS